MVSDRTVKVRIAADLDNFNRNLLAGAANVKAFSKSLDTSTDRMGNLVQTSLALGPALVPITAAAIPAISGLTNQLAFAAVGAGVAALAFQGVGDALKSVNQYQLEPTAANFDKMRASLATLGPEGQNFVMFLQKLRPELQQLQDAAQEGLFPGMESGLTDMMNLLPQAERIVSTVASSIGQLIAEAGDNLDSPKWKEFFDFLETEARPTLLDMGRTLGNFAEGFANLWMAFAPVSSNFSKSFLGMSRDFAAWTDGLSETQGFQEFLDYIERVGPKAWDTLGALGNALLQIVEAAAPIGEATLPAITALSKIIATLADSDLGPVIIGVVSLTSAFSRMIALSKVANSSAIGGLLGTKDGGLAANFKSATAATTALTVAQEKLAVTAVTAREKQFAMIPTADKRKAITAYSSDLRVMGEAEKAAATASKTRLVQMGKLAAGAGILGFAMSDLDNKMGLSNTAMGASIGLLGGPWGVAIGAAAGGAMDLAAANDDVGRSFDRVRDAIKLGADGYDKQVAALAKAKKAMKDFADARDQGNEGFIHNPLDFLDQKNNIKSLFGKSDVEENSAEYKKLVKNVRDLRAAKNAAALSSVGLDSSLYDTTKSLNDQTFAILGNIAAHNERASALSKTTDAEVAGEAAMDNATETIKKNGKTLNIDKDQGRNNVLAIKAIGDAWNNLEPASQLAVGAQKRYRDAIIAGRVAAREGKKAAEAYADSLMHVPPDVPTEIKLLGKDAAADKIAKLLDSYHLTPKQIDTALKATDLTKPQIAAVKKALANLDKQRANPKIGIRDEATDRLRAIRGLIDGMHGKTIRIVTQRVDGGIGYGGGQTKNAVGNIYPAYAAGGFENHVAQIGNGVTRVWNEPETKGEAYIPLADDWRRPRAEAIWAETGRLIGMQGFARGAVIAPLSQPGGSPSSTPAPMSFSLVGAQVAIDPHTNIATFVRGEILAVTGAQSRHDAAATRRKGRN